MLTGEYKHSLDAKNRVFVPAKFREYLGKNVVVAKSFNGYLVLYSEEGWNDFIARLTELSKTEDIRNFTSMKRKLMRGAVSLDVDAQGRICVDVEHREYAGLAKDVSFVGMGDHAEIWAAEIADGTTDDDEMEIFRAESERFNLEL